MTPFNGSTLLKVSFCPSQSLLQSRFGSETTGDGLELADLLIREILIFFEQAEVRVEVARSFIREASAKSLQETLACDEFLLVHEEALSFAFEHLGLHLHLKSSL